MSGLGNRLRDYDPHSQWKTDGMDSLPTCHRRVSIGNTTVLAGYFLFAATFGAIVARSNRRSRRIFFAVIFHGAKSPLPTKAARTSVRRTKTPCESFARGHFSYDALCALFTELFTRSADRRRHGSCDAPPRGHGAPLCDALPPLPLPFRTERLSRPLYCTPLPRMRRPLT